MPCSEINTDCEIVDLHWIKNNKHADKSGLLFLFAVSLPCLLFCFVRTKSQSNASYTCMFDVDHRIENNNNNNKQTKSLLCIFCVHLFLCADCFFADMAGNQQLLERFCTLCSTLHPLHSRARNEENGTLLRWGQTLSARGRRKATAKEVLFRPSFGLQASNRALCLVKLIVVIDYVNSRARVIYARQLKYTTHCATVFSAIFGLPRLVLSNFHVYSFMNRR